MIWLILVVLSGCTTTNEPPLRWYPTCGGACDGYTGPFVGVRVCDAQMAGDPCHDADDLCDLIDDCDVLLICAQDDPADQAGGCPASQRR